MVLVTQGAHGVWELSVNKLHHADMVEDLLEALVAQLANADLQVWPAQLICCVSKHFFCVELVSQVISY